MTSHRVWGATLLLGIFVACGGKAVVDGPAGTGGEGAGGGTTIVTSTVTTTPTSTWTSTGTTTWTTTGTTTGTATGTTTDVCEYLGAQLDAQLAVAMTCDPMVSFDQCNGGYVVYDQCGCSLAANATNPAAAGAALDAYYAWEAEGCGPWDCEWCPPGPLSPWFCMPDPTGEAGVCSPAYEG